MSDTYFFNQLSVALLISMTALLAGYAPMTYVEQDSKAEWDIKDGIYCPVR